MMSHWDIRAAAHRVTFLTMSARAERSPLYAFIITPHILIRHFRG